MPTRIKNGVVYQNGIPIDLTVQGSGGPVRLNVVTSVGRTAGQLASAPTSTDIARGVSTVFYDVADPSKRYTMTADQTSFVIGNNIIVGTSTPNDADGHPDGTIYINEGSGS